MVRGRVGGAGGAGGAGGDGADQCLCPLERFPVALAVPGRVTVAGPS